MRHVFKLRMETLDLLAIHIIRPIIRSPQLAVSYPQINWCQFGGDCEFC